MPGIFGEDQYIDNEVDFCKVRGEEVKTQVERIFLANRISYFVKFDDRGFLGRLFAGGRREEFTFRINARDVARADELVGDLEDVRILAEAPEPDWSPKEYRRRQLSELAEEGSGQVIHELREAGEQAAENVIPIDEEALESPEGDVAEAHDAPERDLAHDEEAGDESE